MDPKPTPRAARARRRCGHALRCVLSGQRCLSGAGVHAKCSEIQGHRLASPGLPGLFWELNPGPLAPEARIMPLDQTAGNARFSAHAHQVMHAPRRAVAGIGTPCRGAALRSAAFCRGSVACPVQACMPSAQKSKDTAWQAQGCQGCSGNWTQDLSHPKRESCH